MARSEAKRQKKIAAKKARDRVRRQKQAAKSNRLATTQGAMEAGSRGEVVGCYLSSTLSSGLRTVVLIRQLPSGMVAYAMFLVDCWCMGVKNCSGVLMGPAKAEESIQGLNDRGLAMRLVDPSLARAIVEGSIEYAGQFGISPHSDYADVKLVWGGIDRGMLPDGFEFGSNGSPVYIAGPYESPSQQLDILRALRKYTDGNEVFRIPDQSDESIELQYDEQGDDLEQSFAA